MSNRDIRSLVGLCSFYVEFVSHRFAPSVFAVWFHWKSQVSFKCLAVVSRVTLFLEPCDGPVLAFRFGGSPWTSGNGGNRILIKFEQFLSSPLSLYCCISTIFAIVLWQFSSSFLCLVSLLLVSKVSLAIDGKHNVSLCLWRPQGVFSHSHVTLT